MTHIPAASPATDAGRLAAVAWRALGRRDWQRAAACCEALTRDHPDYADGWHAASVLALHLGRGRPALDMIVRALELVPDEPGLRLHKALALRAAGQTESAVELAEELADMEFPKPHQYQLLGGVLVELRQYHSALAVYGKLCALQPDNAGHHYNLAAVLRFLGRLDAAEAACDRAIALDPLDSEALMLRSDLRTQTVDANHVAELAQRAVDPALSWRRRVQVLHAWSKELEDLGEHQAAFLRLREGASLRRRHMRYDVARDEATMNRIAEVFDAACCSASGGHDSAEPIFVIGLPRTGTTLVERLLNGHPAIRAVGELDNFASLMSARASRLVDGDGGREALVQASAHIDAGELGAAYVASTRPHTGQTPHFVDKMPLNFLYAGLIRRALPRARLVHLVREPMDTGFAIYKRLFKQAYPFSYDLDELARYYLAYRRLMSHWHAVMPGVIHDVHYERLVADPETGTKRLLEFLELDFDPTCLAFHRSPDASSTASASQIRQPVYTRSVGRWRHHAAELAPFAQRLAAAGVALPSDALEA